MPKNQSTHKYIILGAGPAGLQLGYFFSSNNTDYLILEKGDEVGTTFLKQPIHNKLISINKVNTGYPKDDTINLRWDWHSLITKEHKHPFTELTSDYFPDKKYFVTYLNKFARDHNLNIKNKTNITHITKKDNLFVLTDDTNSTYLCEHLIVATGVNKPYLPNIPGIEHAQHYDHLSLDKSPYTNKRVLIIGKGNSGFETADHLIDSAAMIHVASPSPLKFAWRTHYVGHLRAVNNNFLDTYQLKSQNAVINAEIKSITPTNNQYRVSFEYKAANGEQEDIIYDHIIACTGFQFDDSIFDNSIKPETGIMNRFPKMTSFYESVNISNCYFAGTLTQYRDFKKKQSGFVHGFRYNIAFLARYLHAKNEKGLIPSKTIALTENGISDAIIARVNKSSSLWQQTGYLCDLFILDLEHGETQHYQSIPTDFVHEHFLNQNQLALILTLDFGQERVEQYPDVFSIPRVHKEDYKNAAQSTFIHPIIRLVQNGQTINTHHIIEDFDSIWTEKEHIKPLQSFLYDMINQLTKTKEKEFV